MANIVLASASPRRQALLRQIGITDFQIRVPHAEETFPQGLTPQEAVSHISRVKSEAVASAPEEIVITADTMVFLEGRLLGKPAGEADALEMLTALQGRRHTVCTGVTVRQEARLVTECESTHVYFRSLTEAEILAYIRTGEPMDKAGGYGIQGLGALLVERIEGDYSNAIGLPLLRLSRMLERFGVHLL